jgi:hypothetical protein
LEGRCGGDGEVDDLMQSLDLLLLQEPRWSVARWSVGCVPVDW